MSALRQVFRRDRVEGREEIRTETENKTDVERGIVERGKKRKFDTLGDIIPELVRKYKTFKPTELAQLILADYNADVTPQSVTMFFTRHSEVEKELRAEVQEVENESVIVNPSIFKNGAFEELPSIKKWLIDITPRVSPRTRAGRLLSLRNICRGTYQDFVRTSEGKRKRISRTIEAWSLKSPERLTIEHVKEFVAHLHAKGKGTAQFRLAARDFFLSRDRIKVSPTDISGEKGEVGKYSKVVASKEALYNILNYVKAKNFLFYVADHVSYKTATRLDATLIHTRGSNLREEDGVTVCDIVDKGLHRKGRKPWTKIIPPDVRNEILWLVEKYGDEVFKDVNREKLRELNKEAYRLFLKDNPKALELGEREPFHFWRHMFAQHMLRATEWNYVLVAELGGWSDIKTLKDCYGSPPTEMLRRAGLTYIPTI